MNISHIDIPLVQRTDLTFYLSNIKSSWNDKHEHCTMYEYVIPYHNAKDQEFVFYQKSQGFMEVNDFGIQYFVGVILESE